MNNTVTPPDQEPERQHYFIGKLKEWVDDFYSEFKRKPTAFVCTFGCQMNARDSEKLRGILLQAGYETAEGEEADLVVYNTCTVRENANLKVYGRLGVLNGYKKKNPNMKIALCGCMMQEEEVVSKIQKSYPFVDLIFGTHNLYKFAELLFIALNNNEMTVETWDDSTAIVEELPKKRKYSFKSGVNIMFGCNNFCSYCIVPYVRGREKSRYPIDIIREIEKLASDGVKEIMLLGQNVNSYGKTLDGQPTFAQLLYDINKIDGLERIRFMTSHPKDLSDELIYAMAECDKVCDHLHLPLQSGSSRLLQDMNRHYDKEKYLSLVDKIRNVMPDISLTTDIIVGYPGESEEDFLETMDVVKRVRYDSAFTFIYSKRTKTPAAEKPDQIPEAIVHDRFDRLLDTVQKIGREQTARFTGRIMNVLVEEENQKENGLVTGRLTNNFVVHLPGNKSDIGHTIPVKLDECKGFYYLGSRIDGN
ncbi:MAG: tRNA (N6-isopentenyl adenosine(37)-C2)-methylthiotransferase MiaB [Lachnospiraceae bacterium]|nr:tRNA (N6-isopentenyl adenosine(37)-C2)-methylthiotransferase MiaB [Lachnospiraceae bacterium]